MYYSLINHFLQLIRSMGWQKLLQLSKLNMFLSPFLSIINYINILEFHIIFIVNQGANLQLKMWMSMKGFTFLASQMPWLSFHRFNMCWTLNTIHKTCVVDSVKLRMSHKNNCKAKLKIPVVPVVIIASQNWYWNLVICATLWYKTA